MSESGYLKRLASQISMIQGAAHASWRLCWYSVATTEEATSTMRYLSVSSSAVRMNKWVRWMYRPYKSSAIFVLNCSKTYHRPWHGLKRWQRQVSSAKQMYKSTLQRRLNHTHLLCKLWTRRASTVGGSHDKVCATGWCMWQQAHSNEHENAAVLHGYVKCTVPFVEKDSLINQTTKDA